MSMARWALCALLLVLVGAPLSVQGLEATSNGGWPAIGFAIALMLVAGPEHLLKVVVAETILVTAALTFSYDEGVWLALVGSVAVVGPAFFAQHFLTRSGAGHLRLDEVDNGRYHLVTVLAALLCAAAAMAGAAPLYGAEGTLIAGLMSFLSSLTAQLAVLPMLIRESGRVAAARPPELILQRALLTVLVAVVFVPATRPGVAFLIFPILGWAAIRSTRRETHVQLFLVCLLAYALTFDGRGPLAGRVNGVPESLTPALIYLFMAAACYMTVPLTMAVERLSTMSGHASRTAMTVERLLEAASGALIIATDEAGRITHYNTGAQQALGYTAEQVIGRTPSMFHTESELALQASYFGVRVDHPTIVLEMVRRGERRHWEFIRQDGRPRMVSLTLSEVNDPDGEVIGYIGAGEDITERLRTEEALRTALEHEHASVIRLEEVDHVKQELVSNVSHELRTPITSIAGYAELLADGSLGELTEGQVDALERIGRNTGRLGQLVEDLLTLSRAESGQLELEHEQVDLRAVVRDAREMFDEALRNRSLDVRLSLPDEPVSVVGDARALERVVANLMGNGIKFTPDGGQVKVIVAEDGHEVSITVCDNGLGIPLEDQQHLFTRFFRASAATEHAIQGTGLGLSIVHSIVSQHGGSVSIDSAPGSGTTVTVLLPNLNDPAGRFRPVADQHEPTPARRTGA